MNVPVFVIFDGDEREVWAGSALQFAREQGHDLTREVIEQFRTSRQVHGNIERAFFGGGAAPHFTVDMAC